MSLEDKESRKAYQRKHYHERKNTELYKQKRERERPARLEKLKEDVRKRKEMVYSKLGGKCWCCGVTHIEFLHVDANEGIRTHYKITDKKYKNGTNLWQWLIKNDFPEGFKLICANCDTSYRNNGYCPHQKGKKEPST